MADFCQEYGKDIKSIINIENIKTVIKKIENDKDECNDQETLERLNWAKQAIIQILEWLFKNKFFSFLNFYKYNYFYYII